MSGPTRSVQCGPCCNLGAIVPFNGCLISVRHSSKLGKGPEDKVAVIFNRVPAVFDTAHVGLVFTDVMRHGHCGARISLPFDETQGSVSDDARMPGRSWAPPGEPNSFI